MLPQDKSLFFDLCRPTSIMMYILPEKRRASVDFNQMGCLIRLLYYNLNWDNLDII